MIFKFFKTALLLGYGMAAVLACAPPSNTFVLLPDPNGQVGELSISNRAGTRVLKEAQYALSVKGRDELPGSPALMEEKQIEELFGKTLKAQPDPPEKFVLYFTKGTSDLTEESEKLIPAIHKTIKDRDSRDISVIGHTDRVGKQAFNFKLGFDRARVIMHLLSYQGVLHTIIEVDSHGEDNPLIKTDDEVAEPRNRRVEVVIR